MNGYATMTKAEAVHRFLIDSDDYLARIVRGRYESRLLERGHGLDITYELLPANVTFYMDSANEWPGFEFVYLVAGQMALLSDESQTESLLEPGTCIIRHAIPERSYFRAHTDVELLHVCSPAAFEAMGDENENFFELATQLEANEYVDGHCKRMEKLSVNTGEKLGLTGQQLGNLSLAAFFHDIGKVKVPDEILNKPDRLTPEEFEIIKRHSSWGHELMCTKEFLRSAAVAVEQVHERVDGGGYPKGLKGDAICIEAKIISIVDSFDAMTSDRPYRAAMPQEEAILELRRCAGTQFDPQAVSAFLEVLAGGDRLAAQDELIWADEELTRRKQRQAFLKIGTEILDGKDIDAIVSDVARGIRDVTVFPSAMVLLMDTEVNISNARENLEFTGVGIANADNRAVTVNADLFNGIGAYLIDEFRIGNSYRILFDRIDDAPQQAILSLLAQDQVAQFCSNAFLNIIPLWMGKGSFMGFILTLWDHANARPTAETLEPIELFANLAALAVLEVRRRTRLGETVEKLEEMVVTDPLTGLYNRRYLYNLVPREQARAERHQYGVGLIMMDLINFRHVNNEHGHIEGDRVLQEVAAVLRQQKREEDSLVRYGGDEFVLLMPYTPEAGVEVAATRIRQAVATADFNVPFQLSVRTGTTFWEPGSEVGLENALQIADDWMYGRMGK